MDRILRGGMIGGGLGAFIGPIHRKAAVIDGDAAFVAGAFSADPEKSVRSGRALRLDAERVYSDYRAMADRESSLPAKERLDFVSVVTPNDSHYDIARTFLEAGFNVICDKPMTTSVAEAVRLRKIVQASGKVFVLTHSFTGYPMVKEARHLVQNEALGKVKKIVVEYPQGWLARFMSPKVTDPLPWRLDPDKSGKTCSLGDVGTHAENLARYITGLRIEELCAELISFVPRSALDTDVNIMARYEGGAFGLIHASQVLAGEENGLAIRIYGTERGLSWDQENPNYLTIKETDGRKTVYSKGGAACSDIAKQASFLPVGHPDGYIEAFANIYREAYRAIKAEIARDPLPVCDYPTVEDGVESLVFIEACLESTRSSAKWQKMRRP